MKRSTPLVLAGLVILATGILVGFVTATVQQETNYMVIETFEIPSDRSINDAQEQMMDLVRAYRRSGAYESARLFMHSWGPEIAFYLIAETNDWASIPAGFGAYVDSEPGFMDQALGWASHTDNILTEVPVQ